MKVMGHRGAAGLALENTVDSFEVAKIIGVDFIELDVHISKDQKLVVIHDPNINRVSSKNGTIKNMTYKQISAVTLIDNKSNIPLLQDVLQITNNIPLMIEIKSSGCVEQIIRTIKSSPARNITIASFKHSELKKIRAKDSNIKLFALENTNPFEIIQFAARNKMNGIGLNFWLLNPLTYFLARRRKLSIYVYTVNNKFIGNIISFIYPAVIICSDYPERFIAKKNLSE